jgi:hypothetical protein
VDQLQLRQQQKARLFEDEKGNDHWIFGWASGNKLDISQTMSFALVSGCVLIVGRPRVEGQYHTLLLQSGRSLRHEEIKRPVEDNARRTRQLKATAPVVSELQPALPNRKETQKRYELIIHLSGKIT